MAWPFMHCYFLMSHQKHFDRFMECQIYTTSITNESGVYHKREKQHLVAVHDFGLPKTDMLAKYFSIEQKTYILHLVGSFFMVQIVFFGTFSHCNLVW